MNYKEAQKLNQVRQFETFDAERFLADKTLQLVEMVKDFPMKLTVKIVEDRTEYKDSNGDNAGKQFSVLLYEDAGEDALGELVYQKGTDISLEDIRDTNVTVGSMLTVSAQRIVLTKGDEVEVYGGNR